MDWPKIEDALHAWLKGATGVTCIWAEQSGPQPKPPYCTLRIDGPRRLGGADELRQEADGHDVRQLAAGQRELTVQCQAFTAGMNGQATARELLTKAQARLSLPAVQEQLADVGLSVIDEGNVQNVSTVLETKWQGRAALDVRIGCADSAEDRVGSIESVEFAGP